MVILHRLFHLLMNGKIRVAAEMVVKKNKCAEVEKRVL